MRGIGKLGNKTIEFNAKKCVILHDKPTHSECDYNFLSKNDVRLDAKQCVINKDAPMHTHATYGEIVQKIGLVKGEVDEINLKEGVDDLYDINNEYHENLVSWSSKIHPSVNQPISTFKKGLYFFANKNKDVDISNIEFNFVNELGLTSNNQTISTSTLPENYSFALIYFGICNDINEYQLVNSESILEVHKFTNNTLGNDSHLSWYKNNEASSTIDKLEFGNTYLINYDKTSFIIPGAIILKSDLMENLIRQKCTDEYAQTPTPINTDDCCEEDHIKTVLSNGSADDVNNISLQGNVDGVLCWPKITEWDNPKTFNISFDTDGYESGGLKITTSGYVNDVVFKFYTKSNICYEGILEVEDHEGVNVWLESGTILPTPTPTPVQSIIVESVDAGSKRIFVPEEEQQNFDIGIQIVIDKDTSIEEENEVEGYGSLVLKYPLKFYHPPGATVQEIPPTPTPTPTFKECCDDQSPNMILITEGMANSTNPSGPSGVTITGFQKGGKLCLGEFTDRYEPMSCIFESRDKTFSGFVTTSFEPLTNMVLYETPDGKCFEGIFINSVNVPQILTER